MNNNKQSLKIMRPEPNELQQLVFDPLCWLKLQYFCHYGNTEIGGFAISPEGHPLYIEHFQTVKQITSAVTVEFADSAVADYFDWCIDAAMKPYQFARIWLHTHPGDSAEPSSVDERTFAEVFGRCDWSVMFILSRTGRIYARLAFSAGPGGSIQLPVVVDWERWPQHLESIDLQKEMAQWQEEYKTNIHPLPLNSSTGIPTNHFAEMDVWYDEQVIADAYQELSKPQEPSHTTGGR